MYLKKSIIHLKRRPIITFVIILMYTIAILLCVNIFERIDGYFTKTNIAKPFCGENSYYVANTVEYEHYIEEQSQKITDKYVTPLLDAYNNGEITDEDEYCKKRAEAMEKSDQEIEALKTKQKSISDLPNITSDCFISETNIVLRDTDMPLLLMSEDYAAVSNMKVISGKWFDPDTDSGELQLIAFEGLGYSIGDKVKMDYQTVTYTAESGIYDLNYGDEIVGTVVGIVKNDGFLNLESCCENNGAADGVSETLDDYISPNSYTGVIGLYDADNVLLKDIELNDKPHIITLDNDITDAQYKEYLKYLSDNNYYSMSMKNCYDNTYAEELKNMQNDIVFIIMAAVICLIGVIGVTALSYIQDIKTYAVYYINGMPWRKSLLISNLGNICMTAAALILFAAERIISGSIRYSADCKEAKEVSDSLGIPYDQLKEPFSTYISFNTGSFAFVIIFIVITIILAAVIPYFTLRKADPKELLQKE